MVKNGIEQKLTDNFEKAERRAKKKFKRSKLIEMNKSKDVRSPPKNKMNKIIRNPISLSLIRPFNSICKDTKKQKINSSMPLK